MACRSNAACRLTEPHRFLAGARLEGIKDAAQQRLDEIGLAWQEYLCVELERAAKPPSDQAKLKIALTRATAYGMLHMEKPVYKALEVHAVPWHAHAHATCAWLVHVHACICMYLRVYICMYLGPVPIPKPARRCLCVPARHRSSSIRPSSSPTSTLTRCAPLLLPILRSYRFADTRSAAFLAASPESHHLVVPPLPWSLAGAPVGRRLDQIACACARRHHPAVGQERDPTQGRRRWWARQGRGDGGAHVHAHAWPRCQPASLVLGDEQVGVGHLSQGDMMPPYRRIGPSLDTSLPLLAATSFGLAYPTTPSLLQVIIRLDKDAGDSARLDSARLDSARLGGDSARLDSAKAGSAKMPAGRPLFRRDASNLPTMSVATGNADAEAEESAAREHRRSFAPALDSLMGSAPLFVATPSGKHLTSVEQELPQPLSHNSSKLYSSLL